MKVPSLLKVLLKSLLVIGVSIGHVFAAEAEAPKSVRIASVAYFDGGKASYVGIAAVIAQQGWLAQELKKRGIELEWVPAPHSNVGPVINEAFANNSLDFAAYGDLPSIILNAGGVDTRIVVPTGRGLDTFLVVPANSTAKTIQDLKGKRIAIHRGRPWEVPFIHLLEKEKLDYKDFKILNINPPAGAAALAANSVDALYTLNDAFVLEDKKVGRIIWSTQQAPADWRMRAELWGAKSFIDRHPDLTQLVATAYIKAAHWAAQSENKEAIIKIGTRSGAPESVIRREYDDGVPWRDRWSPLFENYVQKHYQHTAKYAIEKN